MGNFSFTTAGESHGKGLVAIIEGIVADLPLTEEYISRDMKRRQKGYGRGARMNIESDNVEILSGVRYGFTIGTPLSLFVVNRDWNKWQDCMSINVPSIVPPFITSPRPGHADLAGVIKYGLHDIRSIIERSSARETAARVAVGAVARRLLEEFHIVVKSRTISIGGHVTCNDEIIDWSKVEDSSVRCSDPAAEQKMIKAIDSAIELGDTLGGVFEVMAFGVPVGLGSHVQWRDKLDGQIAGAIMSINSVKGVEIGSGFSMAQMRGSEAHDIIKPNINNTKQKWQRPTNRAGGIEGGISNGEPIIVRAAVKPIPSLKNPLPSIDIKTGNETIAHYERSDVCIVPAAGVIGEAMLAIVLANALLIKFGGDNLKESLVNYNNYISSFS
jgi:chorismate synthase